MAITLALTTTRFVRGSSLSSTAIAVTYPENITAENISSITLKANVTGVDGVSSVDYVGKSVYNENTLILTPVNADDLKLANVIEISLDGAKLNLDNGACVYSSETNLATSTAVPNASQKFTTVSENIEVTKPTEPQPTTEPDVAQNTTSAVEPTTTEEVTEPTTQADKNNADTDLTSPQTGQTVAFGSIAILLTAMFAVILLFRRRKSK